MRRICTVVVVLLGLTGLSDAADTNPFANIYGRNSFGLKAPVVPAVVTPEAPKPVVKITLTGFVTLAEQRRATFMRQVGAGAPVLFSLAEGEKNDSVEVLKINELKDTVTIIHAGETNTLMFDAVTPAPLPPPPPPAPAKP